MSDTSGDTTISFQSSSSSKWYQKAAEIGDMSFSSSARTFRPSPMSMSTNTVLYIPTLHDPGPRPLRIGPLLGSGFGVHSGFSHSIASQAASSNRKDDPAYPRLRTPVPAQQPSAVYPIHESTPHQRPSCRESRIDWSAALCMPSMHILPRTHRCNTRLNRALHPAKPLRAE